MKGISIIICCYNSESRIERVLNHLAQQKGLEEVNWEIILVNNNSSDDTVKVAKHAWEGETIAPLVIVDESKAGLSHARRRGFITSQYDFLCFVDDDNWLCENYVEKVYQVLETKPEVAACGGYGIAATEEGVSLPDWFEEYKGTYAVGPQQESEGYVSDERGFLYGAGLTVRKSAWQKLLDAGFTHLNKDRSGKSLSSGGDVELCMALRLAGYQLWYCADIHFQHLMTEGRLTWEYLLRLHEGFGPAILTSEAYRLILSNQYEPNTHNWQAQLKKYKSFHFKLKAKKLIGRLPQSQQTYLHIVKGKIKALEEMKQGYDEKFTQILGLKERLTATL